MLGIAERAHAADGMSGQMLHIIRGEHFCFHPENMLELAVVDLHVAGCYYEDRPVFLFCVKRKCLCDPCGLHADSLGGELDCSA